MRAGPSPLAVARVWPSGVTAIERTTPCPSSEQTSGASLPVAMSQTRTVPSAPAVISVAPSALTQTAVTAAPDLTSHQSRAPRRWRVRQIALPPALSWRRSGATIWLADPSSVRTRARASASTLSAITRPGPAPFRSPPAKSSSMQYGIWTKRALHNPSVDASAPEDAWSSRVRIAPGSRDATSSVWSSNRTVRAFKHARFLHHSARLGTSRDGVLGPTPTTQRGPQTRSTLISRCRRQCRCTPPSSWERAVTRHSGARRCCSSWWLPVPIPRRCRVEFRYSRGDV